LYWFNHPSSSFCECYEADLEVFRRATSFADPEVCIALDHGLGLHLRDRAQDIHTLVAYRAPSRFASTRSDCEFTRPKPCGCFSGIRLLELGCPSGDVCAEVRSSRAYHTRHLPPLGFLIPSTVCSFRRIACPVSYKHHLWGSKNSTVRARSSSPGRLILGTFHPGQEARTCR
jgi:hypothetical protein